MLAQSSLAKNTAKFYGFLAKNDSKHFLCIRYNR